jgi:hypothetical protein
MIRPARAAVIGFLVPLALAGCQSRLNDQRTINIDSGKDSFITLDAPRYDQTVSVTVSADVPVDVYLFLEKDQAEVDRDVTLGKQSSKVLAAKEKVQNDSLEGKVPAKQKPVLMIRSTKSGTATLKIVGK